ncbi:MAG: O-antigen polymerase [Pseudomonadota bacterium]
MTRSLSPLSLLCLCWALAGIVTVLTLAHLDDLDMVQTFIAREGISTDVFGLTGLAWVAIGFLAYLVGDLAARVTRPTPTAPGPRPDLARAARLTFLANLLLLAVTGLWIATSAAKLGGLMQLVAAAYVDSLTTRDLMLENKLFTGMRLFYAALPATASLAAGLLATGQLRGRTRWLMLATLGINTAALMVLPIVMSQRLLLLQLMLSAYLMACLVRGRVFGLYWIGVVVTLFFGLWAAREAITNPTLDRSALDIAWQKLAFYVVNDMFNGFAPLTRPIPHTLGGTTLEGVMFLTFTDGYFLTLLAPRLDALDPVIGGGEFPIFTAAFVDYGPIGGALFLALMGFVLRRIFARARISLTWAAIYAQIGAAMLFSAHSVYFLHQNFYFSAALLAVVLHLSTRRRSEPNKGFFATLPKVTHA